MMKIISNMINHLLYLLSKLNSMFHNEKEEIIEQNTITKVLAFQKILAMNNELKLKSDGKKWNREELYERHKDMF